MIKKKLCLWLGSAFLLMAGYPWMTVRFAPAESAMALCFLMFYVFAPFFSMAADVAAGRQFRSLWCLTIFPSVFFVIGTWLCFDMGETDFLLYAAVYLVLGFISALLSLLFHWIKKRK